MDSPELADFRAVIGLWPKLADFADDIGASLDRVRKWAERNSIPSDWWVAVVTAAQRRGYRLSYEDMARIASGVEPMRASA